MLSNAGSPNGCTRGECKGVLAMLTRRHANAGLASTVILASTSGLTAQTAKTKKLPPPRASGGKPLHG